MVRVTGSSPFEGDPLPVAIRKAVPAEHPGAADPPNREAAARGSRSRYTIRALTGPRHRHHGGTEFISAARSVWTRRGMRRGSTSGRGCLIFSTRYAAVPARCRRRHDGLPDQDSLLMYEQPPPGLRIAHHPRGGLVAASGVCLTVDCAAKMKFRVLLQTPAVKNYSPGA